MTRQRLFSILIVFGLMFSGCATASDDSSSSVARNSVEKVKIGLTEQQVLEILGKPREINTWKDDSLLYEGETAWHYDRFLLGPYRVIYFKNGLVTQVEEFYK